MNDLRTLVDIEADLEHQSTRRQDYVVDAIFVKLLPRPAETGPPHLVIGSRKGYELAAVRPTKLCHAQLAFRAGIPLAYYKRMLRGAPQLLTDNVNHWISRSGQSYFCRLLDGRARAFLSSRYRPLDHLELVQAVRRMADANSGVFESVSGGITETRMYLKLICAGMTDDVAGNSIQAGVLVSNSEVGVGSLRVDTLVLADGNAIILGGIQHRHIGKNVSPAPIGQWNLGLLDGCVLSKPERHDDKMFWRQVELELLESTAKERFASAISLCRTCALRPGTTPSHLIDALSIRLDLTQSERDAAKEMVGESDATTQYEMALCISRIARTALPDRALKLARLAGDVLLLPDRDWFLIK